MGKINLKIFETPEALYRAGAAIFVDLSIREVEKKGVFTAVLSGGSTPEGLYRLLGSPEFRSRVPWPRVHLFWGDERCVSPESEESNYNMAKKAILGDIDIPPENIHRMHGEEDPGKAAGLYEEEILGFFGFERAGPPAFDLVLLGLGEDGHTLSLFPSTGALKERRRFVIGNYVERIGAYRLTMTLPVVNSASNIIFLVSGGKKAGILKEVMEGKGAYPAQMINPLTGELTWLVDKKAAALL